MIKRKICVVSGSRAEYGLLYWLMKEIQEDYSLQLQLLVTGMHLSPEYGLTYKVIENDGFEINEKIEMLLSSDTPNAVLKSIGLGIIGFADAFQRLNPDIIVLLGDRFEILAAAQAAMVYKIPLAHIHGGETTEGAIDESIRHAITKMSHLHFVASEIYRKRVIQLGEQPDRVFNYGAPGLENINRLRLMDRTQLEKELNFKFGEVNFLITYHPVTLSSAAQEKVLCELFKALDNFPEARLFFTKSNSDTGNKIIIKMIEEYVQQNIKRARVFTSLGQLKYLSLMKTVDLVIGNSSSGLIEAPALKKATVNIGDRQKGRLKALSVIDCEENADLITIAIEKTLDKNFQKNLNNIDTLYGKGNVSNRIKELLKGINLDGIVVKKFYDFKEKE